MDELTWGLLLGARVFPALLLLPPFGGRWLPLPARVGLAVALAVGLTPRLSPAGPAPAGSLLVAALLQELLLGAVLAFAAGCAFAACQMGGRLLDELRGAGRQLLAAATGGEGQTPLELLHSLLAVLLFFAFGGPERLLAALRENLRLFPLGTLVSPAAALSAGELALRLSAAALAGGLGLALPIAASLLGADLVLGFAGRLAPGMPLYFLGLPLKAALALMLLALSLPAGLERAWGWFW